MPVGLAILLAKGKLNYPLFGRVFKNRWLFASSTIVILLLTDALQTWGTYLSFGNIRLNQMFWLSQILSFGFPLTILALVLWLLPMQNRKAYKNT